MAVWCPVVWQYGSMEVWCPVVWQYGRMAVWCPVVWWYMVSSMVVMFSGMAIHQ